MPKIRKVEPGMPKLASRKKVAAYARVSMETERLMHSLSAQVSYYSELIQKNPEWEYAGVYADDAVTGTRLDKRSDMLRLLEDCKEGKIEISLPKWIQSHKTETALKPLQIRHFTAFASSSVALGKGRFSVLCG